MVARPAKLSLYLSSRPVYSSVILPQTQEIAGSFRRETDVIDIATVGSAASPRLRNVSFAAQDLTTDCVLQPVENVVRTVRGQTGHDEVKSYTLENEAVNTALVTRLLRVESRIGLLTAMGVILVAVEVLNWVLR